MSLDAITLEVLRNRLDAIADNMESTLIRCAYSGIIKEGADCSVALFDISGQTVAQGLALPLHLGSMPPAVEAMLADFPASEMNEGDVIIMNDPYLGGQHNPDIICIVPVVHRGETVALAVSLAHHQDVGGRTAGSNPPDSTDVFEEGLCLPPLKLMENGRMVGVVEALIRRNVRYPDLIFGDLNAQIACGNTAAKEMVALLEKYGRDVIFEAITELMNRAETQTRKEIDKIPDGTYHFTDWLDNDGIELDKRIGITVAVTIKGSEVHADFTGTSPQVRGPLNAVPSCALSAVRYVIRVITDPDIPNNEGCYRMIRLTIPEKSVLNPRRPAPVNCRAVTLRRVVDTTLGAFAQALPGRVPAANNGHPLQGHFSGVDGATGKLFILSEMGTGGMGARPTKDGIDGLFTDTSNAKNIPVEIGEATAPLRVQYYQIRTDSGGAGRYRGGCGLEKEYECLTDNVVLAHRGERHYTQPWGQAGGAPAATSRSVVVRADGREEVVPSKQTVHLNRNDRIIMWTSGGGGYGDPLERPAERVLDDVLDLRVSPEAARELYGVVIDGDRLHLEETTHLREQLRQDGTR
ncbi:MAG: hydantoinase B/oxoprolinase family protein [Rhodospirillales bacterium]|jgi:N-methylhydantoinase B|nr:hydantoinase B/oxoprolinase family protein [Rhodospirillales bacterium]